MTTSNLDAIFERACTALTVARQEIRTEKPELERTRSALAHTVRIAEQVTALISSLATATDALVATGHLTDDRGQGYELSRAADEVVDDLHLLTGTFTSAVRLATTVLTADLCHWQEAPPPQRATTQVTLLPVAQPTLDQTDATLDQPGVDPGTAPARPPAPQPAPPGEPAEEPCRLS
jgi:predicted glutamine amidotransferase